MTELEQLARRCEAAKGPSYELDCAIWDAVYPEERQSRFEKLTAPRQPYHGRLGPADMDGYVQPLRAFTASIDAALTLVPADSTWHVSGGALGSYVAIESGDDRVPEFTAHADTPALAMCAAALRARSAEHG